jgi:hypothetical protein
METNSKPLNRAMLIKTGALIVKLNNGNTYQVLLTEDELTIILNGLGKMKLFDEPLELDLEKYEK